MMGVVVGCGQPHTITQESQMVEGKAGNIQLKMDRDTRALMKSVGVMLMECVLDQSHYSLTMVSRICDINPQWLRQLLKKGKVAATKNSKGHWVIARTEVARVWGAELSKHVTRATTDKSEKGWTYRRPTEWAYHLTTKYITTDPSITDQERQVVQSVMDRAKIVWEEAYQERLAKKEANKNKKK
jgi:hypothetical protein